MSADERQEQPVASMDESQLRHPMERPLFIASAILNLAILGLAITCIVLGTEWLQPFPLLAEQAGNIEAAAIAVVLTPVALVILRHTRRGAARAGSIQLCEAQFPGVYRVLVAHCRKLRMSVVPELYLTLAGVGLTGQAYSTRRRDYIVLNELSVDAEPTFAADFLAFLLGYHLGSLRLRHTAWWSELLLTYVEKIPWLRNPISHVRTYSCDRYAASLAPEGVRGLILQAVGRRLLGSLNVRAYLEQVNRPVTFWERLADISRPAPHVARRITALYHTGLFSYEADLERFTAGTTSPAPVVQR